MFEAAHRHTWTSCDRGTTLARDVVRRDKPCTTGSVLKESGENQHFSERFSSVSGVGDPDSDCPTDDVTTIGIRSIAELRRIMMLKVT